MRALSVLALAVAACGGSESAGTTVRDSAGIVIAETSAGALASAPRWQLVDPPALQIGALEGDPAYQFAGIEAVRRLADGRFLVADRGSAELRIFAADGTWVGSHGGSGDAPGEYRYLTNAGVGPADSLWTFDFGLRRFTVLEGSGATVRTTAVGTVLAAVTAVGRLRDGAFVVQEQWSAAIQTVPSTGLVRNPAAVGRLSADGSVLDTIVLVSGREVFIGSEDGRAVMSAPLLAHHAVAATNGALVFVGDQTRFEIRAYDGTGILRHVVRVTGLDLTVRSADRHAALEARLSTVPEAERRGLQTYLEDLPLPPTRPAYGSLILDDVGHLWVGSYEYTGPSRAWTAFGPDGTLAATLPVPPGFALHQVTGDLAVGVWRDEVDVEYVRAHRIVR